LDYLERTINAKTIGHRPRRALLGLAAPAQAAPDYTQGVTSLSGTDARIWFKPTAAASLVDVHFLINGQSQQNSA